MIENKRLADYLAKLLKIHTFKDYSPNGLQVEGRSEIRKIITGVTASQALIDAAILQRADAILVHHGYFWKNESPVLLGHQRQRIASLLKNNINLYAYHLPLDMHPTLGNNQQLGLILGVQSIQPASNKDSVFSGVLPEAVQLDQWVAHCQKRLNRDMLVVAAGTRSVLNVAWCTGGAQHYIDQAIKLGVDVYISGEISEQTAHLARENNIHYIAAGHHATERYGIKALGQHIAEQFSLPVQFIDINNPA